MSENEDLKPSERLKKLHDETAERNRIQTRSYEEKVKEKITPLINELNNFLNQSSEIEAIVALSKHDQYFFEALHQIWVENSLNSVDEYYKSKEKNPYTRQSINLISSIEGDDIDINNEIFKKSDKPEFFKSIAIILNLLRREDRRTKQKRKENTVDLITYQLVEDEKTNRASIVPTKESADLDPNADNHNLFKWYRVREFIPTLPDRKNKITYLINLKARYDLLPEKVRELLGELDFSDRCSVEIERQEKLLDLEAANSLGRERGKQSQIILAIHYLLKHSGARDNNTKKAELAAFLSGYSSNTLRQDWSNIHSREGKNRQSWEEDMKVVRQHFQNLGLLEIVQMIDNDLNL